MLDQNTETQSSTPESGAQLQIQDLLICAQAIQLASQRGAFRAEEFSQVGGLYDRLVAFLKESGALTPAPAPTASSQPTSEETVSSPATE